MKKSAGEVIILSQTPQSAGPQGPGERMHTTLTAGRLASGQPIEIPVIMVRGPADGPTVYVQAAVHGSEVNGIEVIRRFLTDLEPSDLSGTVIAVPVANVLAFVDRQRRTPWEDEDMNRVWPGKENGTLSERMAHSLFSRLVRQADAVIDLHTGYTDMVVHTVYMKDRRESRQLAEIFGTDVLIQEETSTEWEEKRFHGKLRNVCDEQGIPAITPELGGGGRFEETPIALGVRGIWNVLRHLGMVAGAAEVPVKQTVVAQGHLTRALAPEAGLFVPAVAPGDIVEFGQTLGSIYGIKRLIDEADVVAPAAGMVVAINPNPTVHTGEMIAMMGRVIDTVTP
ncbi:MAG: succinylglutamate desuccinylase/aspartoacylase family protein [Thermaerobacterales bacterium]